MVKFRTPYNYNKEDFLSEEVNDLPSQTRQSDYEPLSKMVERVIRGEIMLNDSADEYEFEGDISSEDLERDDPLDAPDFDFSDTGSIYQDDIRGQLDLVDFAEKTQEKETKEKEINAQEREASDASAKQSDASVPV